MADQESGAAPAAIGPLDVRRVMAALPHRYPMLLVDRVEELVPTSAIVAIKAVTMNEHFFQGHFPGRPIMPGVLIVEAMAQAAGVLAVESLGLAGAASSSISWRSKAPSSAPRSSPACCCVSRSSLSRSAAAVCKFAGKAMVDGKLAAEAQFHGDDRRSAGGRR